MGQTVECRSRSSFTAHHLRPVFKGQICRDDQALTFVGRTDHVEQQFRPDLAGWHVPKSITIFRHVMLARSPTFIARLNTSDVRDDRVTSHT